MRPSLRNGQWRYSLSPYYYKVFFSHFSPLSFSLCFSSISIDFQFSKCSNLREFLSVIKYQTDGNFVCVRQCIKLAAQWIEGDLLDVIDPEKEPYEKKVFHCCFALPIAPAKCSFIIVINNTPLCSALDINANHLSFLFDREEDTRKGCLPIDNYAHKHIAYYHIYQRHATLNISPLKCS